MLSKDDIERAAELGARGLMMRGARKEDVIQITTAYGLWAAAFIGHYSAERLGCMVVPGGALNTKGRINKILEVKATGLLNTPTYGVHMAEVAKKMGHNPREMGIKRMLCAGEPLPQATRSMLEEMWDAEVYDHIGGTEACAWAAMCRQRRGMHVMEPYFLVEILDMKTQRREVEPGEIGVAVVTPLGRRSFPMIRFNTKDVVRKGKFGCACGRASMMIEEVAGRTDDLKKIRGVLFTPVGVEELLRGEFREIGEFEIVVERKGVMDQISLKFEAVENKGDQAHQELIARLGERLKIKTNLTFRLVPVKEGSLPRYDLKAKRFKDLR